MARVGICNVCGRGDKVTFKNEQYLCDHCRFAGNQPKSFAQAIQDKDTKLIKEIEKKVKEGTMVRLF